MSSIAHKSAQETSVDTVGAKDWSRTPDFRNADVLKIDIEGAEFSVLPRLSQAFQARRPVLLLSVHGYQFLERFPRLGARGPWLAQHAASFVGRTRRSLATPSYGKRLQWDSGGSQWAAAHVAERRPVSVLAPGDGARDV